MWILSQDRFAHHPAFHLSALIPPRGLNSHTKLSLPVTRGELCVTLYLCGLSINCPVVEGNVSWAKWEASEGVIGVNFTSPPYSETRNITSFPLRSNKQIKSGSEPFPVKKHKLVITGACFFSLSQSYAQNSRRLPSSRVLGHTYHCHQDQLHNLCKIKICGK